MTEGYIGILKQGKMFRTYYREGKTGTWKPIRLDGETETPWSDQSFKAIFRHLQEDERTGAWGILVISDQEESVAFPEVKEALSFSYEELRDFCQRYASGAAHWIWQGKELDEGICLKVGFPMDNSAGDQYILSPAELSGNLEGLLTPESAFPEKKDTIKEIRNSQEVPESTTVVSIPLTEKQRSRDAYFKDICNGARENPLKKW